MLATDAAILGAAVVAGFVWGWVTGLGIGILALTGAGGATWLLWPRDEGK
jgi:hypothetical protein